MVDRHFSNRVLFLIGWRLGRGGEELRELVVRAAGESLTMGKLAFSITGLGLFRGTDVFRGGGLSSAANPKLNDRKDAFNC